MKTLIKWQKLLPTVAISALAWCTACSDPVSEEETTDDSETIEDPLTSNEVDQFLKSLQFANSSQVTGSLPAVVNSSTIKMNIKDTLYLMEGVKIPIRLSHPVTRPIAGVFIAAKNSTFYYDVPVEQEEESDTVSVILVDIDPEFELPVDVPIEIVPYDDNIQAIDIVERIITVEEPSQPDCDITVDRPSTLTDSTGSWTPEWFWHHTIVFNSQGEPTFINAPGVQFITNTTYEGCCDYDENKNCNILSTTLNAEVNVSIAYSILSETFAFFNNGTFVRQTHEQKQNFNPETTQWCSGTPGYSLVNDVVTYQGTHNYMPGAESISYVSTYSSCDLCGYGSLGGTLTYSCHLLIISKDSESSKQVRVYVRNSVSEWYD